MEISTEATELKNTRKHVVKGPIVLDELKAFLAEVYSSSDSASSMNALWDMRDADFDTITAETAGSVMEFVSLHWGKDGSSRAAVIVSPDLEYSMSRTYRSILDGATSSSVEVFKDMIAAQKWVVSGPV